MQRDDKTDPDLAPTAASNDPSAAPSVPHLAPPTVYVPACGVLCDIFW